MEESGKFLGFISSLDNYLSIVRSDWNDQTALTFDCINENFGMFTSKIWQLYTQSNEAYEYVKNNFNEAEFDGALNQISAKIETV